MKTLAIAAVVAASLFSATAFAQQAPVSQTQIVVSSTGLDLSTAQGRAALDLRILHAARSACGTPSPADARGPSKAAACVADLRLAAAAQRDVLIASAQRGGSIVLAGR
jgi:UrcA family protein